MSYKMQFVEVDVEVLDYTEKAVKVSAGDEPVWIPRSTLSRRSDETIEDLVGEVTTIFVDKFMAEQKGLY